MLEVIDRILEAEINLEKANAVCCEILDGYFIDAEPDAATLRMDYSHSATLLNIVQDYLHDMAPLLRAASDALREQTRKEGKA